MDHGKRTFIGLNRQTTKVASKPLRPPWTLTETLFLEACTGCGNCIKACPEQIVSIGSTPFPIIDFSHGECTFCEACVDSCNDNAFSDVSTQVAWNHKAVVSGNCLPKRGVACQSCQDACDVRAISFYPRVGGPAFPEVNPDACNGCGACFSVCPNNAIDFIENDFIEKSLETTVAVKRAKCL